MKKDVLQLLSLASPALAANLAAMDKKSGISHEDTCATCWHGHTTDLKIISKTGWFCARTHKEIHPMDNPCECFRISKYFEEKQK